MIALTHFSNSDELAGSWIGELVTDSENTLWVGTDHGISYRCK